MLRRQVLAERAALCSVAHPCICALVATAKTAIALYLVLELVDGPELCALIHERGGLGGEHLPAYAACIVGALHALHERHWIYRDTKAENFVFGASGMLKLVDLGLARRLSPGETCYTVVGTVEYMAPELLQQKDGYSAAADWWAAGCLLYEIYYGHTPWLLDEPTGEPDHTMSDTEISRRILEPRRAVAFPTPPPRIAPARPPPPSTALRSLLIALLERAPEERLGGGHAGGAAVRAHPFFASIEWDSLDAGTMSMPPPPQLRRPAAESNSTEGEVDGKGGGGGGGGEGGAEPEGERATAGPLGRLSMPPC